MSRGMQTMGAIAGAQRWVEAMSNWGGMGAWSYRMVKELALTDRTLHDAAQAAGGGAR